MKLPATPLFALLMAAAAARGGAAPPDGSELRYLVFLRPDPARKAMALEDRQKIQDAHMANIRNLANSGILVAAGPMEDDVVTISGIFVFKADSLAEAQRIAAQDPTVVAGRNTVDAHPWSGPAGIGTAYFTWKKENPGAADVMASHAFCLLKRGPAWRDGSNPCGDGFADALRRAGALAAAGPINDDSGLVGIVVFKSASLDDARKAIAEIPALKAGLIAAEFHLWWTADRVLPW